VIEKLRQARWVVQIQPAHHCLKPCGESVNSRIGSLGSATGPIAATTHQIPLLLAQDRIKVAKGLGLCLGTDLGHYGAVQHIGTTG
jgi:hypothetical protein